MRIIFYVFLSSIAFVSCNVINPIEDAPAYLFIPTVSLDAGPTEGTDSQQITEAWIYANDQIVGVFDLPALVPVIGSGETKITVYAGIKNNGMAASRIKYPFYQSSKFTLDLQPLQTDTLDVVFEYQENLSISEINFNDGEPPFEETNISDTALVQITDPALVFEGSGSAYAKLTEDQFFMQVISIDQFEWEAGEVVFLEMDYSCNNRFSVGLNVHTGNTVQKNFALILNPTKLGSGLPDWNKVYVDLGAVIRNHPNASYYEIYFECVHDIDNDVAELYFDNLKFVSFN